MANKIKYHGKIRLNFAKVFSILKDKTTVMDYTVDSQIKKNLNFIKQLQNHMKLIFKNFIDMLM